MPRTSLHAVLAELAADDPPTATSRTVMSRGVVNIPPSSRLEKTSGPVSTSLCPLEGCGSTVDVMPFRAGTSLLTGPGFGGTSLTVPAVDVAGGVAAICSSPNVGSRELADQVAVKRQRLSEATASSIRHKEKEETSSSRCPSTRWGLRPEGLKVVEGFEAQDLRVAARCGKKLPKTQSWCFVPLIFSALGRVPARLVCESTSTEEQIADAQSLWCMLFSHWPAWRSELRSAIDLYGAEHFDVSFLPATMGSKSWTTSLVFGEPRAFGKLPHPQASKQDKIIGLLAADTQNQIFSSVVALTLP